MNVVTAQPSVDIGPRTQAGRGVPVIADGVLHWLDADAYGFAIPVGKKACVLVPAEDVLLVVVDLPLSSHRQRMEAAPFAVEGLLAEPLANVHVSLGPEVAPKRYLAGIVRHSVMDEWIALLSRSGLSEARILPDALVLPVPERGAWSVDARGYRTVVRRDDSSGFAIGMPALASAWQIAGCPKIVSYGDPLPETMSAVEAETIDTVADKVAAAFDLRQGIHATASFRGARTLRRAGWIAGIGALVLAAILIADTLALDRLAAERRATVVAQLQQVMPGISPDQDIATQFARLMPAGGGENRGRFLPLLSRVSQALEAQSDGLSVQTMTYDVSDAKLSFEVTAEDLAALQRIEQALTDAGLDATSGAATADKGAAQVRIIVQDDGAGGAT